jgi:paraquat-inducible protein B
MTAVDAVAIFQILFAVSVVVAGVSLALAARGQVSRRVLWGVVMAIGAAAVAAWVAFALSPQTSLAASAAGLTASLLAAGGAIGVQWGVTRAMRFAQSVEAASDALQDLIDKEAQDRAIELERVLARARADSISLLAEEERRIAEERRTMLTARERAAGRELTDALGAAQQRVEQRLAEWGEDLERAQGHLTDQLQRLAARQKRLIEEAEERLAGDAERLESESEAQRSGLVRLREDLQRATEESIATGRSELEAHAADRTRALQELSDRLRRREVEIRETIEREESEALQRIQAIFSDVERRLAERLARVVERTTTQHAEAATLQFADTIKRSREEAARRLTRELDRAVAGFTREAETVISERLTNVGDAAAQRLDRRLAEAGASIDRQRDDIVAALEVRFSAAEDELRQRLEALAADGEAERGILEARLHELSRRIEQT